MTGECPRRHRLLAHCLRLFSGRLSGRVHGLETLERRVGSLGSRNDTILRRLGPLFGDGQTLLRLAQAPPCVLGSGPHVPGLAAEGLCPLRQRGGGLDRDQVLVGLALLAQRRRSVTSLRLFVATLGLPVTQVGRSITALGLSTAPPRLLLPLHLPITPCGSAARHGITIAPVGGLIPGGGLSVTLGSLSVTLGGVSVALGGLSISPLRVLWMAPSSCHGALLR